MAATTPLSSASHFIPADDDDDEFDEADLPSMSYPGPLTPDATQTPNSAATPPSRAPLSANTKGKGRALPSPSPLGTSAPVNNLEGNIGSSTAPAAAANARRNADRRWIGGVQVETRYTGMDTLDEPITTTMGRDLLSIYSKLVQVLYPRRTGEGRQVLRDWDLWGPLLLCLGLGVMLSINAPPNQSLSIFSSVIVLISVGSVVVTLQTQLLGGKVSFFQALCVLGYCIAPLDIAALIATFLRQIYIRVPVCLFCWAWCVWAAMNFFDGTKIETNRVLLAVYPLLLFYFILAWMILIQ